MVLVTEHQESINELLECIDTLVGVHCVEKNIQCACGAPRPRSGRSYACIRKKGEKVHCKRLPKTDALRPAPPKKAVRSSNRRQDHIVRCQRRKVSCTVKGQAAHQDASGNPKAAVRGRRTSKTTSDGGENRGKQSLKEEAILEADIWRQQELKSGSNGRVHWLQQQNCNCGEAQKAWLAMQKRENLNCVRNHWLQKRGRKCTTRMTPEEKETYRKVFQMLDEDGGNTLDFEEISLAMKMVGMNNSMDQLKKDVIVYGNADGELDLNGFLQLIEASQSAKTDNAADIKKERTERKKKQAKANLKAGADRSILPREKLVAGSDDSGDSSAKAPREMFRIGASMSKTTRDEAEAANAAALEHLQDIVLPFHLFLPAYSRKKNLKFVMDLKLIEDARLPHPLEEAPVAVAAPHASQHTQAHSSRSVFAEGHAQETLSPRQRRFERLLQCSKCKDCSDKPRAVLEIENRICSRPSALEVMVSGEEDLHRSSQTIRQ